MGVVDQMLGVAAEFEMVVDHLDSPLGDDLEMVGGYEMVNGWEMRPDSDPGIVVLLGESGLESMSVLAAIPCVGLGGWLEVDQEGEADYVDQVEVAG